MAKNQGTSPWVWIGCGCAAAVLLAIAAVVGAGIFGARAIKGFAEDLEDPQVRQSKVLEILGAEALPEGLNAQTFFSIPFVMDLVVLSDAPPGEGSDMQTQDLGERALFYLAMRNFGDAESDLEKILAGDTSQLDLDVDLDFRSEGALGRGEFESDRQSVRWASHLGSSSGASDRLGIYTILLVDCAPSDEKLRMAYYWAQLQAG